MVHMINHISSQNFRAGGSESGILKRWLLVPDFVLQPKPSDKIQNEKPGFQARQWELKKARQEDSIEENRKKKKGEGRH